MVGAMAWAARRFGARGLLQALLVGLISAAGWLSLEWIFDPPQTRELVAYPCSARPGDSSIGLSDGSRSPAERRSTALAETSERRRARTRWQLLLGGTSRGPTWSKLPCGRSCPRQGTVRPCWSSPDPGRRGGQRGSTDGWTRLGCQCCRSCGARLPAWSAGANCRPANGRRGRRGTCVPPCWCPSVRTAKARMDCLRSPRGTGGSSPGGRPEPTSPSVPRWPWPSKTCRASDQARRSAVMGEPRRLAHEIHDTLIQGFASIVMNLEGG